METAKPRIHKYDNIKGIAIILIVLGHLILITNEPTRIFVKFIYIFHLPLFFFVSGYFSKNRPTDPIKACKRILIPYIVFCILLRYFSIYVHGFEYSTPVIIYSSYGMWFLFSLFMMKMLLPILNRLKHPLLISIIIALLFGLIHINKDILGISRTFTYMPIFLLGFYYNSYKEKIDDYLSNNSLTIKRILNSKIFLGLSLIVIFLVCMFISTEFSLKFIKIAYPYASSGKGIIIDMLKRLLIIIVQISIVLLANKLITNKETVLTKIGKNSMAIYIFHIFFIRFWEDNVLSNISNPHIAFISTVIFTLILVAIFSQDIVSKYYNKAMDGIYDLFFYPIDKLSNQQ